MKNSIPQIWANKGQNRNLQMNALTKSETEKLFLKECFETKLFPYWPSVMLHVQFNYFSCPFTCGSDVG